MNVVKSIHLESIAVIPENMDPRPDIVRFNQLFTDPKLLHESEFKLIPVSYHLNPLIWDQIRSVRGVTSAWVSDRHHFETQRPYVNIGIMDYVREDKTLERLLKKIPGSQREDFKIDFNCIEVEN